MSLWLKYRRNRSILYIENRFEFVDINERVYRQTHERFKRLSDEFKLIHKAHYSIRHQLLQRQNFRNTERPNKYSVQRFFNSLNYNKTFPNLSFLSDLMSSTNLLITT